MLKRTGKKICLIGLICLICPISLSFAASNIVFEATVDKNVVSLGERIQLSLTFQGATDVPAPQITEPEGLSAKYLGPSTMMSIVNGRMSSSISHNYILAPLKAGKFTLGPFSAEYQGQKFMSQTIDVEVVDPALAHKGGGVDQPRQQASRPQRQKPEAEEQLKDRIFVELEAGKRDIYLNEPMPVMVRLYVNKLAIRDIEYPVVAADGFSKEKFGQPNQYQKALADLVYDVIEFKTTAYPIKKGVLALGPAEIKCNLVVRRQPQRRGRGFPFDDFFGDDDFFSGFFDRYETYPLDLKSTELQINVKPLPDENKPDDFTGAIGEFDLEVSAEPLDVKVGDPITLKMMVSGTGNFATVNAPALEDAEDFKVYQPQARMEAGQKIFEQVIMPMSENVNKIPVISFGFFNPKTQTYQTVKRGPFAITVSKPEAGAEQLSRPKLVEMPLSATVIPEKEEMLGKDIVYIKDKPGIIVKKGKFLYQSRFFIWIFILPLVLFIVLFMIERKNQRLRTDIRYARIQKAYKRAQKGLSKAQDFLGREKKEDFYNIIFKVIQGYISDRYIKEESMPQELSNKLKEFYGVCDAVRFAGIAVTNEDMQKTLQLAREIVETLEKTKL